MAWIIFVLLLIVAIHACMSVRYNYDWIGANVRKLIPHEMSVTELYPIPSTHYMDRFETYTRIPKMKENTM